MRRTGLILVVALIAFTARAEARSCTCSDSDGCLILNAAAVQAMLPTWDQMTGSQQSMSLAAALECAAKTGDQLDVASKPLVATYFRVDVQRGTAKGCSGVVREAVFRCNDTAR